MFFHFWFSFGLACHTVVINIYCSSMFGAWVIMNDVIVQLSNVTAAFLDFLVQIGDEGLLGVLVLRSPTLDHQLHLCVVAGDGDLLALDQQAHYPLGCCAIGIMY